MKIKLYFGNEETIKKSGIGRALKHQMKALTLNNIPFTHDKNDKDYDILHINTIFPSSPFLIHEAHKLHKKIIYHAHSTKEDFKDSFVGSNAFAPFYKKWLISLYKQADVIITPTPYSKRLIESYGLNKKVYAISNGICLEDYNPSQEQIQTFKDYFHINDEKVIISVGWLFERKGFDTFCEVAKALPHYKFIWFGDINLSAPTKKIRQYIKNPPDNVILPGYVTGDVIKGAYGYCDVFFFPSREETEGIVVLEALASNCPVLIRDIGVYSDWLTDGVNCYKASDNEGFISKIDKILNSDNSSITSSGYQIAKDKNLKNIGKELKQAYEFVYKNYSKKD